MARDARRSAWVPLATGVGGVMLGVVAAQAWASGAPAPAEPTRAEAVHASGHQVMPFSLEGTTHVFEMTVTGGIQDVILKSPADSAQLGSIRRHLSHEAARFGGGDFADPTRLHGPEMPGVRELSDAAGRLGVVYEELPNGGRIVFTAAEPELVTAVHRWFGAQLSDHAADATYR